ncbi:GSCFA domain-containing protein [Xanthomarina sp. F1114]|uniref:GSCFA domain-containing protein n=1 Tax=Xanthomarina sp. F1114 TaxID=2996019 RepID=UPI00225E46FD|nr:GSCFA domain-containing protein [Xanthomarina sp. F1114]MCX7548751.1 GSCFA domain-containing protein [Xanthomarina sp. F1114]
MNLQTNIPFIKQQHNQIDYHTKLLLIGSCFVENIGGKLDYFKFQTVQNPFGILFHPQAIQTFITNVVGKKVYTEKDVFFINGQWHCFETHSKLSNSNKEELLKTLNGQIDLATTQLQNSSHIVITLGTAWVYRLIETDSIVANCHKVPQKKFVKELLSIDEISQSLEVITNLIKSVNKKANIIFTVSPIRHLKDGFVENTQSKAHLIAAIHEVLNQQSAIVNHQLYYFPSFELMMDELRDYRFYSEDMIHPNQTAINYIWEKFKMVWISEKASHIMEEVAVIQKGINHKPFNPNSEAHQEFLQNLGFKIESLQSKFPNISF